jgi:hypothetical protein
MDKADNKSNWGETRQKLIGIAAIAIILAAAVWIYRWETAPSDLNVPLHQSIGNVLAEETFRQAGHGGKIVVVTMDTRRAPELKVQMEAFYKHLKVLGGCTIADKIVLDPGENPKYRPGSGLSAKRFLKIARKHPGVDGIVSFVGAPELSDEEMKQMKSVPKFIAETHSPERLVGLFDKKLLLSAIVPRYDFPAPGPRQPQTSRQWFDHYFQVVHPDTVLPTGDELP